MAAKLPRDRGHTLLIFVVLLRRTIREGMPFDRDLGPCGLYGPVGRIQRKLLTGQCFRPK
jgi:hypothetical protein